ncbi:molybdenum-dependent transcriptional regulator [Candidatus Bathyarchaeota archaeon]|nr:MAG: molybdenum-dependent transcriptional regulator [Candidatus Bathyarchaeota archaeon]
MLTGKKHKPSCKVWIEYEGKPLIGKGGAAILEQISREKSISRAAEKLGMSYRYVWNYLKKIEDALGEPVVETFKGGKSGGGGARLTRLGESLLGEYKRVASYLSEVLSDEEYWEDVGLKISARNRLQGKVVSVEKEEVTAKIKVEIKTPAIITALISREAAEELEINVGDDVEAVIKATEILIAK